MRVYASIKRKFSKHETQTDPTSDTKLDSEIRVLNGRNRVAQKMSYSDYNSDDDNNNNNRGTSTVTMKREKKTVLRGTIIETRRPSREATVIEWGGRLGRGRESDLRH